MVEKTPVGIPAEAVRGERSQLLDERYGRSPRNARRERLIIIVTALAFVVVIAAWVIWAGLDGGQSNLSSRDLGHRVNDDRSVTITWEVSVTPGSAVSCALQAQNEVHGIVGWKIVALSSSEQFTRQFTETVRTTQQSVTGLIYRCWLA